MYNLDFFILQPFSFFKNEISAFGTRNFLCVEYTIVERHETFSRTLGRAIPPTAWQKKLGRKADLKRARRIFVEKRYKYNRLFLNFHRPKEIRIIFRYSANGTVLVQLCIYVPFSSRRTKFRYTITFRTINFLIAIYGNNFSRIFRNTPTAYRSLGLWRLNHVTLTLNPR